MRFFPSISTTLRKLWWKWQRFWAVYRCLERRSDLQRLIDWAKRKRLKGPLNLYYTRMGDEEARLLGYTMRCRRTLWWARCFHWLSTTLNPPPRYRAKGSAARYRRTTSPKRQSTYRFSF